MPGTATPNASIAALRARLWPVAAPAADAAPADKEKKEGAREEKKKPAAKDDILHLGGIDAGARDGLAQDVRRQRNAMGLVERPADSLGDPGAAIGDDGDVLHGLLTCRSRALRPSHNIPSDPARETASVREPTASFEKIRLTCDFTVSGEISTVRAMRLFEKPWLIMPRMSRSRAVSRSLTRFCAQCLAACRASQRASRLSTKGRSSRSDEPGASIWQ